MNNVPRAANIVDLYEISLDTVCVTETVWGDCLHTRKIDIFLFLLLVYMYSTLSTNIEGVTGLHKTIMC